MKVKITVTGTLDLCKNDIKALRKVSAGHVMDTMRYEAKDLSVEFEGSEERTKAKADRAKAAERVKMEKDKAEEAAGK